MGKKKKEREVNTAETQRDRDAHVLPRLVKLLTSPRGVCIEDTILPY
jgi:hypothetical protein